MDGLRRGVMVCGLLGIGWPQARAVEVKVSAMALERTLRAQLFTGPEGRYYMRGDGTTPCFVYAEQPHVSFQDDRVVVHVHTRARRDLNCCAPGSSVSYRRASDSADADPMLEQFSH